jgi:hypothetical protein
VLDAVGMRGAYTGSAEELTPTDGDPRAALPLVAALAAVTLSPRYERLFTRGTIAGYALTATAWRRAIALAGRESLDGSSGCHIGVTRDR